MSEKTPQQRVVVQFRRALAANRGKIGGCLVRKISIEAENTSAQMGVHVTRCNADRGTVIVHRGIISARLLIRPGTANKGVGKIGFQPNRIGETADCVGVGAVRCMGPAATEIGGPVIRAQQDRLGVLVDGAIEAAFLFECLCSLYMCFRRLPRCWRWPRGEVWSSGSNWLAGGPDRQEPARRVLGCGDGCRWWCNNWCGRGLGNRVDGVLQGRFRDRFGLRLGR